MNVLCWSKKELCSDVLLACCYFEELKIDCAIDQLKPGLKSMALYIGYIYIYTYIYTYIYILRAG